MADTAPTMKTCTTCKNDYDTSDPAAVKRHTESVDCGTCSRCRHKPSCYPCGSSFCVCAAH